ncbi:hybrid sensor histidine kinase/response regulator [Natrarchaeobius oligotrophus]|uniref:histidine kinase n=1 Tax=Natrarchaeobius chitinivorans TaxID=1679083 RepID=A0A3N6MZG0_NATCH|nr:ATP-binding protein [Natrarchaeobius chitinivorans]RQH01922.1 response regulator [Natrarchaeobius chitinivorans]
MESVTPTLLIVSRFPDRPKIAEAIDRTGLSLEVRRAEDIPTAASIVETEQVDCIVSDYEIPDENGRLYMGGLRLLEHVREEYGELPFIIFTFVVNEDSVRRATTNGVTAYIRDIEGEDAVAQLAYHINSAIERRLIEHRASEQARINEVIRDVNDSLVREQVRDEMIARICHQLIDDEVYRAVGFAFVDHDSGTIDAWGGGDAAGLNGEPSTRRLVSRTIDAVSVTTERADADGGTDSTASADETVDGSDVDGGTTATRIATPVVYEETIHGVLVLETNPTHVFYRTERAVLGELGETIGHALNAIAIRNSLAERERELCRQKEQLEQFASIVSHEIRNPLNVATGNLAAVRERDDVDAPELDAIDGALDRIGTIVDDILTLARSTSPLDVRRVSLDRVVGEAWVTVETGDATLETDDAPFLEADPSQLRRLFENLFRNAIEHGTPTDGSLTVSVRTEGDSIVVRDDGVGIDESIVDDIFEMGTTGTGTGTGLGMAIVEDLADRHGWTVSASNHGDGAQFRIDGVDWL